MQFDRDRLTMSYNCKSYSDYDDQGRILNQL